MHLLTRWLPSPSIREIFGRPPSLVDGHNHSRLHASINHTRSRHHLAFRLLTQHLTPSCLTTHRFTVTHSSASSTKPISYSPSNVGITLYISKNETYFPVHALTPPLNTKSARFIRPIRFLNAASPSPGPCNHRSGTKSSTASPKSRWRLTTQGFMLTFVPAGRT